MKLWRTLGRILPHLTLVFALLMTTLFIFDRFNEAMAFLSNNLTKWLLLAFCLLVIALSIRAIVKDQKDSVSPRNEKGDSDEK